MSIFDWLFSIEGKAVYSIGSNSLHDLRIATYGYTEAIRSISDQFEDPMYPGFQEYVEKYYGLKLNVEGWSEIITERTSTQEEAMKTFYDLLRAYYDTFARCQ